MQLYIAAVWRLWAVTGLALVLCLAGMETVVRTVSTTKLEHSMWGGVTLVAFLVAWLGIYASAVWAVIWAVRNAFRRQERRVMLATVVTAYAAVWLTFAGIYYAMVMTADFEDARTKNLWYFYEVVSLRTKQVTTVTRIEDQRAFRGMAPRLWLGVDAPRLRFGQATALTDAELSRVVDEAVAGDYVRGVERIAQPRFDSGARLTVLGNCLYFSVITLATVGYGDIVPEAWYSKLAVVTEVLAGMALLVVALGMVLGDWWR